MNLYEAKSYRDFVRASVKGGVGGMGGRGLVKRLAQYLRCHSTYVSQVVNGKADLSADQGARFCSFFRLAPEQTEFFLDLLSRDRAAGKEARSHYQARLDRRLAELSDMKKRWKIEGTLTAEEEQAYYESWVPQAVHLYCQLPGRHTAPSIAAALGLPLARIESTLATLERLGFAAQAQGAFRSLRESVHLGKDSRRIARYHINWRQKAIFDLNAADAPPGRHYSSVVTLSERTAREIEHLILAHIEATRALIVPSPPEKLYVYNLDFYPIGKPPGT